MFSWCLHSYLQKVLQTHNLVLCMSPLRLRVPGMLDKTTWVGVPLLEVG